MATLGKKTPRSALPFAGVFPACFRVARSQPGTIQPREAPPLSLHLSYLNDCVIISRALISSPQGGCMVHAACASTVSAPAPLSTRNFLIASRQILKIELTHSQQTRKHFLIASFSASLAPAPHLTNHDSRKTAPFQFNTNKPHKIIIVLMTPLKTKEKRFSIPYKFPARDITNLALVPGRKNVPHLQRARNAACLAVLVVLSCPAASGPNWFAWLGMGA